MSHPLRIFYAAGPGDIVGTFKHWKNGQDDPSQVAMTYSGQFYDLCKELGAEGYAVSYCPRIERVEDLIDGKRIWVENRPVPFLRGPAWKYHLGQVWYGLRMIASAVLFDANAAVVSNGTHWFVMAGFRVFGIAAIPTLHCVLWKKHEPPRSKLVRFINKLNGWFFRKHASAILSLSNDISVQVSELAKGTPGPIVPFLPTYRPESFGEGCGPVPAQPPFRVFFAGRIEPNKGVFDLLEIAKRFAAEGQTDIEFDLCGTGGSLEDLRAAAGSAGVASRFRLHGHATKPLMRQMYEQCHVVIVPTTIDFIEGFNKVVAEGVLAGRPVITSSVCPALEYVAPAVLEVPPNDVGAYAAAILKLRDDAELYASKIASCAQVRQPFYDQARSWKSSLRKALVISGCLNNSDLAVQETL